MYFEGVLYEFTFYSVSYLPYLYLSLYTLEINYSSAHQRETSSALPVLRKADKSSLAS